LRKEFERARDRYIKIKRKHEEILKKVVEANERWNKLLEEKRISEEEWAKRCVDTEFELGLDEAERELAEAEKRLLNAGKKLFEKEVPLPLPEILWNCKFPTIRRQVLDILVQLNI